jgi:hypothetical protein
MILHAASDNVQSDPFTPASFVETLWCERTFKYRKSEDLKEIKAKISESRIVTDYADFTD